MPEGGIAAKEVAFDAPFLSVPIAGTSRAIRFNTRGVLARHHCFVACRAMGFIALGQRAVAALLVAQRLAA
jgi:hypothetical protein